MKIQASESKVRKIVRTVLSELLTTSAGTESGESSSSSYGDKDSFKGEAIGPFDPFEMDSDINPDKWDKKVAKVWDKLTTVTQKFISAVPAAVAALGYAKNENHAYRVANDVVGSTYRTAKESAAATYGGPYWHDLVGRVNGACLPGAYYFAGGDTCSKKPGGVYQKSGPHEELFNVWEKITGFGKEPEVPKNFKAIFKQYKREAVLAGEKIFLRHYGVKERSTGHSGSAIDVALKDGYSAILDKAAELSGTKVGKFKEVDHIHATITESKKITRIVRNIIDSKEINELLSTGAGSGNTGSIRSKGGKDYGNSEKGEGKCSSVPNLCTIKGDKKYIGNKRIGISEPGFWKKFRRGLQRHVNREYPGLGLKVEDLGVSRDLDAAAFPSSSDRVAGSKHGAGMANDLYLHTRKYGKYTNYKKDNVALAKDKKLVAAIRSYVATQPDIVWGGEFGGNGPAPGSRGELEFHHFEKTGSEITKAFSKYEDDLKKIGMASAQLSNTEKLSALYRKLV